MNTKKTTFVILFLTATIGFSQSREIINPKGKFYFGAEIGKNEITSFTKGEPKNSVQIGLFSEYYFARHWSVAAQVSYHKTGVSFYKPNTHSGSWFDLGSPESSGTFNGAVISMPVTLKWEFRIHKNLAGSLKTAVSYNHETKSQYQNYYGSPSDYSKNYGALHFGYGFNYFINKNMAVFYDFDMIIGPPKGESEGFFGKNYYTANNDIGSLGVKYNFKETKKR